MSTKPSKYEAVYEAQIPAAPLIYHAGQVTRIPRVGRVTILGTPTYATVHYRLVKPWWVKLWRWLSK